ncbi:MAG: hypothetical protein OXI46_06695 [Gemmatimonadota bacterium]|nr:hypothetical protein [Gemmatimonadota bacterium]
MTRPAALILAGLLAPTPSFAQSTLFLRVAPEAERVSVEHIKKVTIGGGSSSSASSASGLALSANLRVGAQRELPGKWLLGVEVEGTLSAQRVIEGTIHPTPNGNVHDVWPGSWDYSDRYGTGFSVLVGRRFGNGGSRGYVFGGARRMWTEFATGGVNPANGEAGEDRDTFARTPWSVGIGALLRREWPIDVRVRYSWSSLDWIISQDSFRLDYRYNTGALSVSVGVGFSS